MNPLRQFRERAKPPLTLEQLGALFGVNKSTILRWEAGHIPAERVLSISEKTGIAPQVLRPDLYRRATKRAAS